MIRRIAAALAAAFLAIFVTFGTASMASAHSDTFQSVPADDSSVTTPVTQVQFTFVEPVNAELSPPEVVMVNQDGVSVQLGAPTLDEVGATMTVQILTGALPNGDYTASYRFVSEDGHPTSGELFFTVQDSDAPALVASASDASTDAAVATNTDEMVTSSGSGNDTQLQLVLGLSAAGAVILAGVLVFISLRRRRNSQAK